jgi:hypothetical protein
MITVEVQGIDKLVKKLGHVTDPMGDLVKEAGTFAHKKVKEYAKPHAADSGKLATGMQFELTGKGVDMQALIRPAHAIQGIAEVVERGRFAGKPPPIKRIESWGVAHGFIEPGMGYQMQQDIRAHGTKGVKMFERAAKDTDKELPKMVNETIKRVEKDWAA